MASAREQAKKALREHVGGSSTFRAGSEGMKYLAKMQKEKKIPAKVYLQHLI